LISKMFPLKRNGFFLDLAAADGITHSNTYVLEKIFGWSGICVEPNPLFLQRLVKTRNCIIDRSVVSNKREEITFRIDNRQLGGIVDVDTDNSFDVRGHQPANAITISLNAVLLNDLLELYDAPRVIDYFSLDAEGSEVLIIADIEKRNISPDSLKIYGRYYKAKAIYFSNPGRPSPGPITLVCSGE